MNILALQWDLAWEDRAANFAAVTRLLESAAPAPGSLVVLPEMFATGFSVAEGISEPIDGPTSAFLSASARRFGVTLLGGVVCDGRNQALAFAPDGSLLAAYAKRKPFRPGGETYAPGDESVTFRHGDAVVCPLVCYDLRFPELFRDAVRALRPEVFCVIASWPTGRVHHWLRLLQARAIENQAFVIGVNRCGADPNLPYPGRSVIVDYHGEIVADAGSGEAALAGTLDLDGLRAYRRQYPFLEDISPIDPAPQAV